MGIICCCASTEYNGWPKVAGEKTDARGLQWLTFSCLTEMLKMPFPTSLVNIKREISELKLVE